MYSGKSKNINNNGLMLLLVVVFIMAIYMYGESNNGNLTTFKDQSKKVINQMVEIVTYPIDLIANMFK